MGSNESAGEGSPTPALDALKSLNREGAFGGQSMEQAAGPIQNQVNQGVTYGEILKRPDIAKTIRERSEQYLKEQQANGGEGYFSRQQQITKDQNAHWKRIQNPPKSSGGFFSSVFGMIVIAIVGAVLAVFTAGAALALMAPGAAGFGGAIAGGMAMFSGGMAAAAGAGVAAGAGLGISAAAAVGASMAAAGVTVAGALGASALGAVVAGMTASAIGGFVSGLVTGSLRMIETGGKWFKQVVVPAALGAVAAAATYGVGHGIEWGKVTELTIKPALHGVVQGGVAEINGGDFGEAFLAAATGSIIGDARGSLLNHYDLDNALVMSGLAGSAGGLSAELSGGDFWEGFAPAASVALFNHSMELLKGGQVKLLVEKDGHAWLPKWMTPTQQAIAIGWVDPDTGMIHLGEQWGGHVVSQGQALAFIESMHKSIPGISEMPPEMQQKYLRAAFAQMADGINPDPAAVLNDLSAELWIAAKTAGKANINAAASTVVGTVTLGTKDGVVLLPVTQADLDNGYNGAYMATRVVYEIGLGVATGGSAAALSRGGKVAVVAGRGLVMMDHAGNVVATGETVVNIVSSGQITGADAAQLASAIAGVGGSKGASRVPGRVQSRINLSNDGMDHVIKRHLSGKVNASQFTMSEAELRVLLSSKQVVQTPVSRTLQSADGIRYVREVDVGTPIGLDK